MGRLILELIGEFFVPGWTAASRGFDAVDALDRPVVNPNARRYKIAAAASFIVCGLLALPAALVHTFVGPCVACDVLGYSAIAAFCLCVLCAIVYAAVNRNEAPPVE